MSLSSPTSAPALSPPPRSHPSVRRAGATLLAAGLSGAGLLVSAPAVAAAPAPAAASPRTAAPALLAMAPSAVPAALGQLAAAKLATCNPAQPTLRYNSRGATVRYLQSRLGVSRSGWFGPKTLAAVKRYQSSQRLVVDGVVGPRTWGKLCGTGGDDGGGTYPGIPADVQRLNWRALAQCESSGNPRALNPSGKYRGLYQFDFPTWRSVGGKGDPIDNSVREQTYRAMILYTRRSDQPWPQCGRRLYS